VLNLPEKVGMSRGARARAAPGLATVGGPSGSLPVRLRSSAGVPGYVARVVVLAAVYFGAAELGLRLAFARENGQFWPSAVWPAAGVGLAGLVLFGRRAWPAIAIGGFLAGASEHMWREAIWIAVGQTAAAVVGATLLRARGFDRSLVRAQDALSLIVLGAGVSSALSATVGTTVFWLMDHIPQGESRLAVLGVWWVSEVTGVILVAPLLLVWRSAATAGDPFRHRKAEAAAALVLTALSTYLVFRSSIALIFLVFPFVIWAARRLGVRGATLVNVVLAGVAVWATIKRHGPFWELPMPHRLVVLQSFIASMAIASLLLALLTDECRRALEEVRQSRDRIVEAGNRVRNRVRQDLHDGFSATAAAAVLQLQVARELVRKDPVAAEEIIGRLQVQARAVIEDIRRLVYGLGPDGLDAQGLVQAVKRRASHFARLPSGPASPGTLHVKIETIGDLGTLPRPVELAAYHIVSEAVNNASRHGGADNCVVNLFLRGPTLIVEVIDDGCGLTDEFRPGVGLASMRERAEELGGTCTVENGKGGGTIVRAHLPVV
jgi:signal transduction histidine kinase